MKRNVSKEISSMDLNDKTIVSQQLNVSPGRYNLKLQANEINFENCSTQQYFKNPHRNPFQSPSLLAIRIFFCICCFTVLSGYFYISPNFMAIPVA